LQIKDSLIDGNLPNLNTFVADLFLLYPICNSIPNLIFPFSDHLELILADIHAKKLFQIVKVLVVFHV